EIERYAWPELEIVVHCGPGTYLRALARDLGETLGTGGHCAELRRLASGPFRVEDAIAWVELADPEAAHAALSPAWRAVADRPEVDVDAEGQLAFASGREIAAPPADVPAHPVWVRVHGPGGFLGMGETVETEGALRLRPRRVLFPAGEDAK
ncbi:MAG TPA: tRNA pseudouridine(55) synthase TruB, partial [Gemmatimonadota bacterium]|nr:tRNA pseudouridine(55) synthase TruB [Gemmatimonadota bacterium]